MTGIYDWNSMPHKVDINCPSCGKHAVFEFAEVVKIALKKDVPFFEQSNLFEYSIFRDYCGHNWHGAIYFANLHGGSTKAIRELPEGYKPENWAHSQYLTRSHGIDFGAYCCAHCFARKIHVLNWPIDAFYSVSYKGEMLWAFNRESVIELRDYISSDDRKTSNYMWSNFLLHVPTIFKKQNARSSVVKSLNRMLEL